MRCVHQWDKLFLKPMWSVNFGLTSQVPAASEAQATEVKNRDPTATSTDTRSLLYQPRAFDAGVPVQGDTHGTKSVVLGVARVQNHPRRARSLLLRFNRQTRQNCLFTANQEHNKTSSATCAICTKTPQPFTMLWSVLHSVAT